MNLYSAVFYTRDISAAEVFYSGKLGFKVEYRSADSFISFVFENSGRLGIKKQVEPREIPGHQTVFIEVDDIEGKLEKLKNLGLTIEKDLSREKWATEFSILDPDGNKILFRSPNK